MQKSLNIDKYGNNTHPDWFVQLIQSIELVETETVQLEYIDYHINEIVQFQTGQLKDAKNFHKTLSFINKTNHGEYFQCENFSSIKINLTIRLKMQPVLTSWVYHKNLGGIVCKKIF